MPKLTIDFEARLAQFQDSLDKVERNTKKVGRSLDSAFSGLKRTIASLGVALSVGAFARFVKSGIDAADALGKLSERVGVSVESLSAFQYAAKLSDVNVEQLNVALRTLAKNADDVQRGTGRAKDAFNDLGIQVKDNNGGLKSTEQLFLEIADRLSKMTNETQKVALAYKIFGDSGAQLLTLLNKGSAGFEEFRKQAQRLGLIISTETAQAAQDFNDNLYRLNSLLDDLKYSIAEKALPRLSAMVEELLKARDASKGWGDALLEAIRIAVYGGDIEKANERIRYLNKAISNLQEELTQFPATVSARRVDAIKAEMNRLNDELRASANYLQVLKKEMNLFGEPTAPPTPGVKKPGGGGVTTTAKATPYDKALEALQKQIQAMHDLGQYETILADIEAGRYGKLTEAQETELLRLAAKLDALKMDAEVQKEADAATEAARQKAIETIKAEDAALTQFAEGIKDSLDPMRQQIEYWDKLSEAVAKGKLSWDEANQAAENYAKTLDKTASETNKAEEAGKELGFVMTSALSEAIRSGGDLRDIMQGLIEDVAQLILKYTILEPLAQSISNSFKGGGFIESLFPSLSTSAGGVSGGELPAGIFGAQHGADFTVGAGGGTDSHLIAFRATPGERVMVTPPGKTPYGGAGISNQFFVDMRGASVEAVARLERYVNRINGSIERRAVTAIGSARARGAF